MTKAGDMEDAAKSLRVSLADWQSGWRFVPTDDGPDVK